MMVVHSHHLANGTFVVLQSDSGFQVSTLLVEGGQVKRSTALHLAAGCEDVPDEEAVKLALGEHVKGLRCDVERLKRHRDSGVRPVEECEDGIRELQALIKKVSKDGCPRR